MTNLRELYVCSICGNVVEVVHTGATALVCCNKPMDKLEAGTKDASLEKHVPVIEIVSEGIKVKVGSVAHPMEEKHFIRFIEVLTKDQVLRAELAPNQAPEAIFKLAKSDDVVEVREYCNIHGLWKADL
ncbi:desulfoferrodoxin [Desulfosporosinus burensis]|uniref:desulfoferrodoxin n=1 Tax=Desulfosporosinus sp. BICA1-9 TaxID=1531958 RepID=UPI00054BA13B|nr:desulfoferrodoxin [Desulfosporosinus sp. BICA1-9]KJS47663.1 MAG: DNA topoisomerase II [Peptococcaceae bacterium BRH_c23]KJS89160.1 MAG: DNA topoisomerase II [Desulfosporosinus sp. BICA1-9]HBW36266.1 desulfoferrodoxin [Desulfosporosinus sp.]